MLRKRSEEPGFALSRTRRTLPMALLRARELVMEEFRPTLRSHGVSEQQWRVLRVLQEVESIDASELASASNLLAPSLTRILRTMETNRFIDVRKDAKDARRSIIQLAQEGEDLLRKVAPESAKIYGALEEKLGGEKIERLLDDLEDLIERLSTKDISD